MKIFVTAKPRAKEERLEKIDQPAPSLFAGRVGLRPAGETHFKVSVKEPPEKGRANQAIIGVLAEYFKVHQSAVRLVSGFSSKNKTFEIN